MGTGNDRAGNRSDLVADGVVGAVVIRVKRLVAMDCAMGADPSSLCVGVIGKEGNREFPDLVENIEGFDRVGRAPGGDTQYRIAENGRWFAGSASFTRVI